MIWEGLVKRTVKRNVHDDLLFRKETPEDETQQSVIHHVVVVPWKDEDTLHDDLLLFVFRKETEDDTQQSVIDHTKNLDAMHEDPLLRWVRGIRPMIGGRSLNVGQQLSDPGEINANIVLGVVVGFAFPIMTDRGLGNWTIVPLTINQSISARNRSVTSVIMDLLTTMHHEPRRTVMVEILEMSDKNCPTATS